ncbi:P-loop NTPase fold protein [Peribacillus frigoritolerans]|uniref:P-loop NTPase fold protein n=1 Tax=Peribacillus castrilensis TaxID=2897690 RepID=UPI003DA1E3BB
MKANEIINVLNHFKNSSYQRVLVDGNWGIGKTKYVSDFKEEHKHACYVSLFGKRDINSIIQEIYYQIIEDAPKGKLKKHFSLFREKLNKLDISYFGVSLSIPVIANIHEAMNKELGRKETYIIIFDDLERKHDDLSIKEIFGLIDSLSKIDNIKTVLIAATDQLKEDNKDTFIDYKEKAIDKTYSIDKYADEAPVQILGEQIWKVIDKASENFSFNNLRTFEKTNLFIKEVIQILGEDIFSEKFTRDDLYRMCFATVFFHIEHKGEMKLIEKDTKSEFTNAYYSSGDAGVLEYLYNYILKNSLDNVMSKNVFHHIKIWYETGNYFKENIINIIASINSYEEKPTNFFSSEQEILEVIDHCCEYLRNLNGSEPMKDIISRLSTGFTWCEVLSIEFGVSNEDILNNVKNNISNYIDLEKSVYQNDIDLWDFNIESEEARNIIISIKEALKIEYYEQLIKRIEKCFFERRYSNYSYLREINELIISTTDDQIRDSLIKSLKDNQFFFPIPSGKISAEHWDWCHLITKLIAHINRYWENENYYDDFTSHIYSLEIVKEDKLLQHRLKILFGKVYQS